MRGRWSRRSSTPTSATKSGATPRSSRPPACKCRTERTGSQPMPTQRLGIIMHGVTGRMGMNQHLIRSIVAIRKQGGVTLSNGDKVMPDPILIGRNAEKMEALARTWKIERWGTDVDQALQNKDDTVF